ncbi:MAG: TonB-dependent receptor [Proteobacteria bacterium]|nr:TonB-dependent receptor [Pseudomonadota bacterium]
MLNVLIFIGLLQVNHAAVDDHLDSLADNSDLIKLPKIEVRSQRTIINAATKSSLTVINTAALQLELPSHPNEIFDRVPGAWISRGSGQEHLTAIRSPVLTGAGACGAYMVLEDQVPTRPSGFCNVNQLFEVNLSQADRVDVLRGPGTVTYGSNALHGAISVFTPGPLSTDSDKPFSEFSAELGTDQFYRGQLSLAGASTALQASLTDAGSFRDDEQYQHGLFNFQATHSVADVRGRTSFAYANLDQDTAGFILGKDSYKDPQLRTQNLNPDAFRKAWAARLSSRWNWRAENGDDFELIPYARSSRMDFLQHFLPGTPLEENAQDSFGFLGSWSNMNSLTAGFELEWAEGSLTEFQENILESGSAFLNETRPQGFHYNYAVQARMLAAWLQWQREFTPELELTAGLRAEYLTYDYDNHMLNGNTRDDGTECGFGGCLYTRPADRDDSFTNLSPEFGLSYQLTAQQTLFMRLARGYRAPQATELYRLQKGQAVADLDSVTLDSIEIGINGFSEKLSYELTAYAMRKQNFIFRDANGFNVSDGKSRHSGIEAQLQWQATDYLALSSNLSWAQHEYGFNRDLGSAGIILKGNETDTAPPRLGAVRMNWAPGNNQQLEAEWVYQGDYYLDAANAHKYPGHSLFNLRGWIKLNQGAHTLSLRLSNVFDKRYADRADFAFGNYRYFPGMGRRLSVEWSYRH